MLRSAKRCAAGPGSTPAAQLWVPALRRSVKTLHRVRDTETLRRTTKYQIAGVMLLVIMRAGGLRLPLDAAT